MVAELGPKENDMPEPKHEDILRAIVSELLGSAVIAPLNMQIQEAFAGIEAHWKAIREQVDPVLEGKFAQCPECGSHAFAAAMCEGVTFICPHCETVLKWRFHEKTNRYTLEVPRG
jgi:predicted RNA-binding Zn-ribbon protein involved in translation (DUF1610 family)